MLDGGEEEYYAISAMTDSLALITKQLESLTLHDPDGALINYTEDLWKACDHLKSLSIRRGTDIADGFLLSPPHLVAALLYLPNPLTQLRLTNVEGTRSGACSLLALSYLCRRLRAHLAKSPRPVALQSIQRIVLPSPDGLCDECYDTAYSWIQKIDKLCASSGIQLDFEASERAEVEAFFPAWESYLDVW